MDVKPAVLGLASVSGKVLNKTVLDALFLLEILNRMCVCARASMCAFASVFWPICLLL